MHLFLLMEPEEITAQPSERQQPRDDELSMDPEDIGRHTLEGATEAAAMPQKSDEGDGTVEQAVPPNQLELEEAEEQGEDQNE